MGVVDPASGAVKTLSLDEGVSNSFAVEDGRGVYFMTTDTLYRAPTPPAHPR
jgi:hypothetical protein